MYIYRIFVINLDRRVDKRQRIHKQFQSLLNLPYERVIGIDGSCQYTTLQDLVYTIQGIPDFQPSIFREEHVQNTPRYRAKIGCWLTHWRILSSMLTMQTWSPIFSDHCCWIIILEDDVSFQYADTNRLKCAFERTIQRHENPDIIILGDRIGTAGINIPSDHLKKYPQKNHHYGCESYAVNVRSISKFISYLQLNHVQRKCSIDNKFADLNQGYIKIVPLEEAPWTICIDPYSKQSDIEIV